MKFGRTQVAALSVSAAALVGFAVHEGYTDRAVQPLPGDKWTQGFGSTTREDNSPVKPQDKTDPVRALVKLHADVDRKSQRVKECLGEGTMMYGYEFDAVLSLAYNVGEGAFCKSTMAELFRQGKHEAACNQFMRWTFYQGKDCKDPANRCLGLYTRRMQERQQCLGL